MKAPEKEEIRAACHDLFGDESFDQRRWFVLDDAQLQHHRHRNNVYRPTFYGFLIHDLLSTCALLMARLKRSEELVAALEKRLNGDKP